MYEWMVPLVIDLINVSEEVRQFHMTLSVARLDPGISFKYEEAGEGRPSGLAVSNLSRKLIWIDGT